MDILRGKNSQIYQINFRKHLRELLSFLIVSKFGENHVINIK